jgi:hypothetical protein
MRQSNLSSLFQHLEAVKLDESEEAFRESLEILDRLTFPSFVNGQFVIWSYVMRLIEKTIKLKIFSFPRSILPTKFKVDYSYEIGGHSGYKILVDSKVVSPDDERFAEMFELLRKCVALQKFIWDKFVIICNSVEIELLEKRIKDFEEAEKNKIDEIDLFEQCLIIAGLPNLKYFGGRSFKFVGVDRFGFQFSIMGVIKIFEFTEPNSDGNIIFELKFDDGITDSGHIVFDMNLLKWKYSGFSGVLHIDFD